MNKCFAFAASLLLAVACGTTVGSGSALVTTSSPAPRTASPITALEEILFSGPPPATSLAGSVTESFSHGHVDWSGNSVRATGTGVMDPNNPNRAQARLMAERAAVVVAQRNLLEITEGVRVDSETRVVNFMTDYDVVHTRVQGMVRNARQTGPATIDDEAGIVEVELEMDIYSPQGLSGALSAALAAPQTSPESLTPQVRDFLQQYSGLVIDGGESGLTPSMFPRIFDEHGNLLLDTRQYASYMGAAGGIGMQFISDLEGILDATGLASSPLVLQAVQAAGSFGSDIILSGAEAGGGNILKQALPHLLNAGRFLLRVIL